MVTFDPKNSTSHLKIDKPKREDVGNFECIVDNGIGSKAKQDVMLVVKFKPEMDTGPSFTKSASNIGQVGRLTCKWVLLLIFKRFI